MLHTPHNVDHVLLIDAHLVDRGPFDVDRGLFDVNHGSFDVDDLIDGGQETGFH